MAIEFIILLVCDQFSICGTVGYMLQTGYTQGNQPGVEGNQPGVEGNQPGVDLLTCSGVGCHTVYISDYAWFRAIRQNIVRMQGCIS